MNAFVLNGLKKNLGIEAMKRNAKGEIICYMCGRPAHEHCYSDTGHREVEISGICEECFDKMFAEEDDE